MNMVISHEKGENRDCQVPSTRAATQASINSQANGTLHVAGRQKEP